MTYCQHCRLEIQPLHCRLEIQPLHCGWYHVWNGAAHCAGWDREGPHVATPQTLALTAAELIREHTGRDYQ